MSVYSQSLLQAYREYASSISGERARLMTRTELLEQAALRILKSVGDCASDEDAVKLYEGAKLLGVTGQDKEALDSILALWELVRTREEPTP